MQRIAHEVLGRIVAGTYPAGLRLPSEAELGAEFACGRSTVREALRYLTDLGVVKSRRGSGALVLDFRREGTPALLSWYLVAGRFDRPASAIAKELLALRGMLAREAVRLAARYGDGPGLLEAERLLKRAPSLESDPVAHALNELAFFRALVCASGIWPAVWIANAFWSSLTDVFEKLAFAIARVPDGWQTTMEALFARVTARDDKGADRIADAWIRRVDEILLADIERALGGLDRAQGSKP